MMKPKALTPHQHGLLEYLEDIIGSDKYVEGIMEGNTAVKNFLILWFLTPIPLCLVAFEHVEKLNEVRQEKLNRVKIIEKEKDALEGAKSEAEEFLIKEHQLNVQRANLYQVAICFCQNFVFEVLVAVMHPTHTLLPITPPTPAYRCTSTRAPSTQTK